MPAALVPMKLPFTLFPAVPALEIASPKMAFPEMTLRAPDVVPPMTLPLAPVWMNTPTLFSSSAVPAALVPMKLPWIWLPFVPAPKIITPVLLFPEMTLRAPAVAPPMTLPWAPSKIRTPSKLGKAVRPAALVPMKLPWIRVPATPAPLRDTPKSPLPEIRFRCATAVPPMRLPAAAPETATPLPPLPRSMVPAELVQQYDGSSRL